MRLPVPEFALPLRYWSTARSLPPGGLLINNCCFPCCFLISLHSTINPRALDFARCDSGKRLITHSNDRHKHILYTQSLCWIKSVHACYGLWMNGVCVYAYKLFPAILGCRLRSAPFLCPAAPFTRDPPFHYRAQQSPGSDLKPCEN